MKRVKALRKDNSGVSWYLILGISLILLTVALAALLFYSTVYVSMTNLKNQVKMELKNTSASAAEMIFKALSEYNVTSYLKSFQQHENELRANFIKRLKKTVYLETQQYQIDQSTVKLQFEANDSYINYLFECKVDIKVNLMGENRTLVSQTVYISAKHYYKGIENSEGFTDYINEPSKKNEHNLGG